MFLLGFFDCFTHIEKQNSTHKKDFEQDVNVESKYVKLANDTYSSIIIWLMLREESTKLSIKNNI